MMRSAGARKRKASFGELVRLMARLRAPGGCPWDREQTHRSLLKYLREETREVCRAVRKEDWDNLADELGDVLLQVLFHADIAREAGRFDIDDVMEALKSKLVGRHPHVFGRTRKEKLTPREVHRRWNLLKAAEKRRKKRVRRAPRRARG
ncbi:MAG: MazG nucleotide pyrophosphohydrolase domain-containing protein [Elusimicrobiota bacterium]